MNAIGILVATAFGAGRFPIAPGTVGSAVGVLIYLLIWNWSPAAQLAVVGATSMVGVWASSLAERHFGRTDPGQVVIDEVAGQLVTLVLTGVSLPGVVAGFFLFRILDIFKPWPARRFEDLHGGLGIMADDLMVGLYGNLMLQAAVRLVPGWL
jgi:phosphatidylglycerophosphatase A